MKYTLYHIRGHKWGMTERLEGRLKDQGYTISDCCEFEYYDDTNVAANREKQLNLRDGYGWNSSQDYRVILKANEAAKPGMSARGKKQGKINVESGHWDSLKTTEHQSMAGKKGGLKAVETGQFYKYCRAGGLARAAEGAKLLRTLSKERHTCPNCQKVIGGRGNFTRHLKEYCKKKQ